MMVTANESQLKEIRGQSTEKQVLAVSKSSKQPDRTHFNCSKCGGRHGLKQCPAFGKTTDNCLMVLQQLTQSGWPSERKRVPDAVRPYWNVRDQVHEAEGLMFLEREMYSPGEYTQGNAGIASRKSSRD